MDNKKVTEIDLQYLNIELIKCKGNPAIQLRKTISDKEKIKVLLFHLIKKDVNNGGITVPIKIRFNDRLKAMSKLKEAGLI